MFYFWHANKLKIELVELPERRNTINTRRLTDTKQWPIKYRHISVNESPRLVDLHTHHI